MTFSLCQQFLTDFSAADGEVTPKFWIYSASLRLEPTRVFKLESRSLWSADNAASACRRSTAYTSFVEGNTIHRFRVPHLVLADVSLRYECELCVQRCVKATVSFLLFCHEL